MAGRGDLPLDGPVFELHDYGPHPRYDLEIEIDEWVSHELEDLVDELVTELPRAAGVADVAHEDRERILVASGGVPRDRLAAWLTRWFRSKLAGYDSVEN